MNADDYRDKADLAKAERKPDVMASVPLPPAPKNCPGCGVSKEVPHASYCPFGSRLSGGTVHRIADDAAPHWKGKNG